MKTMKIIACLFLTMGLISCRLTFDKSEKGKSGAIEIRWSENLTGDFSFTKNWNYPEGIYKNDFGQLSCDGLCPPEVDAMKDGNGKIYEDSLPAFYKRVDTTHQFYSIQSEASTYEFASANFVTVYQKNTDTTICFTHTNIATHSRLILTIIHDKCIPTIELNSAASTGTKIYYCKGGQIEIDKNLWERGILKANFDFVFDPTENPDKPMYWKGKIYATIDHK